MIPSPDALPLSTPCTHATQVRTTGEWRRGRVKPGNIVVVTVYAFDETRHLLIRTGDTGAGFVADTVAGLAETAEPEDALGLADALTSLSRALWRTYTHPASAADSLDVNTEGWRRQGERDAFGKVIGALTNPNLPRNGYLTQSYIRVEETAHRVGRALHRLGDTAPTEHVVADVRSELDAVEHAERGDLSGRAKQAVCLTRADASPLQINAADELFREHPTGTDKLFTHLDPTAAAVAAAHWLQAAADVAAEAAECEPTDVVREADGIEALAVETPTHVLERLEDGETPREVVLDLIRTAMTAAEGRIADPDALPDLIEDAIAWNKQRRPGEHDPRAASQPRITLLDPARPAQDLLEDLLDGLRGCQLLYHDEFEDDEDADTDWDLDEAELDKRYTRINAEFTADVRAEAAANQARLS